MQITHTQRSIVLGVVVVIAGGALALYFNKAHAPAPESVNEDTPAELPASGTSTPDMPTENPETEPGDTAPPTTTDDVSELPPTDDVVCTKDAKQCPDGSYVGREGPNCEFADCPSEQASADVTVCTDKMKAAEFCTMEYAPVCGLVEVQCITEPCDPVPETFSNGCSACSQDNVVSYTAGACTG